MLIPALIFMILQDPDHWRVSIASKNLTPCKKPTQGESRYYRTSLFKHPRDLGAWEMS